MFLHNKSLVSADIGSMASYDVRTKRLSHTKEVDVLVDSIALNGRKAKLLDELAAQILNVDLFGTNLERFLLGSSEILFLTHVCHKADDIVAFLNEPCQNTAGV
jgi:hypothetical protein